MTLDPDLTRQRVLEAAGRRFAADGFAGTSVRDIIEDAKANVSAVNYHFRTKEQLYVESVRHAYRSVAARVPLAVDADVPAGEQLRQFVGQMLTRLLDPGVPEWHRSLIMREVAEPTDVCAEFVREFVRPTFELLQGILARLIPADVPEHTRYLLGCSVVGQCLHYHHARHVLPLLVGEDAAHARDVGTLADHITAFTLAALKGLYPAARRTGART